jgi:hypothetical protein
MSTGEITRSEMISFIREKDEFYKSVDLSKLHNEELVMLWETVRASWQLGRERNMSSRGIENGNNNVEGERPGSV